ncbi:MAG: T9SS type A sorting domain-containing protein [Saprospiraceae bacterium]
MRNTKHINILNSDLNRRFILFQSNPNPFNSTLHIHYTKGLKKGELNLINEFGKIVKSIKNITGSDYIPERGNLHSGFYFIRLIDQNEISALSKIIILE